MITNLFILLAFCCAYIVLAAVFTNGKTKRRDELLKKAFLADINTCTDITDCITVEIDIEKIKFMLPQDMRNEVIAALNEKKIEIAEVCGIRVY